MFRTIHRLEEAGLRPAIHGCVAQGRTTLRVGQTIARDIKCLQRSRGVVVISINHQASNLGRDQTGQYVVLQE